MTLRSFLMWYLGAILLVGTAGASGYQMISRHRAELAARDAAGPTPEAGSPQVMAAAQPAGPGTTMTQAAPSAILTGPLSAGASAPHRRTVASSPLSFPPLRSHLTAVPPLRAHLAAAGTSHVSQSYRLADRRAATLAFTAHSTHHAVAQTVTPPRQSPPLLAGPSAPPLQPAWTYAQPPTPSVTYYPYPGYPAYQAGYAYYYPRYQYYRVY